MEQIHIPGIEPEEKNKYYLPVQVAGVLTARQRAFAYFYALTGKKAQSAVLAGFSSKNSSKIANVLFQKSQVQNAVAYFREEIKREMGLDEVRIVQEISRQAYQDDIRSSIKLRALELLGKIAGIIRDKVDLAGDMEVNHTGSVVLLPAKTSPEEWVQEQQEKAQAL